MTPADRAALRAAMALACPSFPCRADKRPACRHGYKDASTPDAGLATLWFRYPGELIGVPTGPASGFSVLDVDKKKGGGAWYESNKARLPQTRIHRTRAGGLHLLFQHRGGLKNNASRIAPGVDTRGEGGYVIWWPATGLEVRDAPLAEWAEWLVIPEGKPPLSPAAQTKVNSGGLDRQLRGIVTRIERAAEGERNSITFWGACRAADLVNQGRLARDFAWEVITIAATRAGLPAMEAQRTVASAFRGAPHHG